MGRLEDERTMMWPRYLKYGFVKGCVNNKPAQCGVRKRIFFAFFLRSQIFFLNLPHIYILILSSPKIDITNGKIIEEGSSTLIINSCIGDATRLWNEAPDVIKNSNSIAAAKSEIKKFVLTLPI